MAAAMYAGAAAANYCVTTTTVYTLVRTKTNKLPNKKSSSGQRVRALVAHFSRAQMLYECSGRVGEVVAEAVVVQ